MNNHLNLKLSLMKFHDKMVTEKRFIFASRMLVHNFVEIPQILHWEENIFIDKVNQIDWFVNQSLQWKLIVYLWKRELVFNSIHFYRCISWNCFLSVSFCGLKNNFQYFSNVWNLFFNLIHFPFRILIFWYNNYLNAFSL